MCGIAGFVRYDGGGNSRALAEEMTAAIRHRGPDDTGVYTADGVALAMRRLAIVDIAGGHQPMETDDGSIVVVYNGEIYNAPALRKRLEAAGVRFRTRSDTEVILRLYERDPDWVEPELAGMWAFAIHDRRRHRVVLSRDRFGIKPLFLADTGDAVGFASELGALRPLASRARFASLFALDPEAAHALLAWSYVPEESTIYRGIRRLAPGTRCEIDLATGAREERAYYRILPTSDASRVRTIDEAVEYIEPVLRHAVREHLESDVPLASFLSGGIDSSLVTALAAEQSATPLTAFSIGFHDPRFDESPFARQTAARIGVSHQVEYLGEHSARDAVGEALLAYDEPFGDSSSIATLLLAKTVAKTHKVAMAGDGGDEVFAGYRKHRMLRVRSALGRVPEARNVLARALGRIPVRVDRTSRASEILRSLGRLARGLDGSDAEAQVALTQVVSLERALPMATHAASRDRFVVPAVERFHRALGSTVQRTLAGDLGSPLANDMLTKVDRATMAQSLEARVPFLDHRVVEAGLGLPSQFTLPGGKRVLRVMHARRFGHDLAARKKQGFGVPVETWLRGALAPACDALFSKARLERHGLLSVEALGGGAWRSWAASDPQVLWHAFALAAWCEIHHGEGKDALLSFLSPRPSQPFSPGPSIALR